MERDEKYDSLEWLDESGVGSSVHDDDVDIALYTDEELPESVERDDYSSADAIIFFDYWETAEVDANLTGEDLESHFDLSNRQNNGSSLVEESTLIGFDGAISYEAVSAQSDGSDVVPQEQSDFVTWNGDDQPAYLASSVFVEQPDYFGSNGLETTSGADAELLARDLESLEQSTPSRNQQRCDELYQAHKGQPKPDLADAEADQRVSEIGWTAAGGWLGGQLGKTAGAASKFPGADKLGEGIGTVGGAVITQMALEGKRKVDAWEDACKEMGLPPDNGRVP
ncbi:glr2653 [Gloeobacter violaceus PCC 7421]|uniref:Glr2653 protein n=2 Tax=Gloeobacter violaceus TaxID=33072 RepID=Q7NH84_GLOVI|nr:glr2653 [Gloeobacter violaceus PCC 7421]